MIKQGRFLGELCHLPRKTVIKYYRQKICLRRIAGSMLQRKYAAYLFIYVDIASIPRHADEK
jgi:hypothetical protein